MNNNDSITAKPLILWFLNHNLQEERLRSQIAEMKQQGLGGFFMHWLDCEEPYMSAHWLRALDVIIDEAARQGLEAWLYDEAWCPSCFAGCRILAQRPDLQLKTIWGKKFDLLDGKVFSFDFELMKILRVCAMPTRNGIPIPDEAIDLSRELGTVIDGSPTPYRHKHGYYPHVKPVEHWRNSGSKHLWRLKWQPPAGEWRIYILCIREMLTHEGQNQLDVLNPESIALFLEETHEVYKKRYAQYFGNIIPGIMTDEPKYWPMPWTKTLPDKFEQRYKIAFTEIAPALFDESFPNAAALNVAYHQLTSDMFRENYIVPMGNWCRKHNLRLVGHISPEECLREEVLYTGSIPRLLESFAIPGTDLIIQAVGDRNNPALNLGPKMASSVASQCGKREVFVEYGACCNENLSLTELKHMVDWLMVTGCNMLCHHGFSYSLEAMRKYATGLSLGTGMRLWAHWSIMGNYIEKRSALLREYRPTNRLAVLKPQTAIRAQLHNSAPIEEKYIELIGRLMQAHIGFDLIDEDTAAEWKSAAGTLKCGCADYSSIIIPPVPFMTQLAADKLATFATQGGRLIAIDHLPFVLELTGIIEWPVECIRCNLDNVTQYFKPDAKINGPDSEDIFLYRGENDAGDELLFLVNMLDRAVTICCNEMPLKLPPFGSFIPGIDTPYDQDTISKQHITIEQLWQVDSDKLNHIPLYQSSTHFNITPGFNEIYLVFEEAEIEKLTESLLINGVKPDLRGAFPGFIYDESNRLLPLNTTAGELVIEYDNSTFATLLVAGDFAAFKSHNGWQLTPKPYQTLFLDNISCGYPFLNGTLKFSTNIDIPKNLSQVTLQLPERCGVAELWLDRMYRGICAWEPNSIYIDKLMAGRHRLELRCSGTVIGILKDQAERFGIDGQPQLQYPIQQKSKKLQKKGVKHLTFEKRCDILNMLS